MGKASKVNLFLASTPYHIVVSCAFMKDGDLLIIEDNKTIHSYILNEFAKRMFKTRIIHVDYYRELFSKNLFTARKNFKKIKNALKNEILENIYIFNDAEPYGQYLFRHYKKCARCVLEEGIGLYNEMYHRKWLQKLIYGKLAYGPWYTIVRRIGEYRYTQTIYAKDVKSLTKKQLSKIVVHEDYKKVDILFSKSKQKLKRKIWLITQPLIEDEICDHDSYINLIKSIIEIAKKNDLTISLKPHPRENLDKYSIFKTNLEIIENKDLPFELLLDTSEDVYLFTISSSAVLKYVDNINVNIIFLYKLLKTKIDYSKIANGKNIRNDVHTLRELERIMNSIK